MKLNKIVLALFATATIMSCQKEEVTTDGTTETDIKQTKTMYFMGRQVEVLDLGNDKFSEGDLIYDASQLTATPENLDAEAAPKVAVEKLAIARVRKWKNNTIVYQIEGTLPNYVQSEMQKAMTEWTSKTNVRFKERTNESEYVTIRNSGASCNCASAALGVQRGGTVNLGSRSSKSVITHEFGHTLGYPHEQNRPDRDEYIRVNLNNITQGGRSQYNISRGATTLTDRLDYNSIMMYGAGTFGNGNGPTMTRLDNGQPVRGFSSSLTALDIEGTNRAYPSTTTTPNPQPTGDKCEGVSEWERRRYTVGDKVTYRGYLFQRARFEWTNLGKCGTPAISEDPCEDISAYSRNNRYDDGATVVYDGSLYKRVNGRWELQEKCQE